MPAERRPQPEIPELERRILDFIHGELVGPGAEVGREDELLTGLLDSVAALRLATFVAEEFAIEIQPADYVIENFHNVAALAAYVQRAGGR